MTQPTLRQRLRGLAATLVILLLVAGVPFLLLAIGAAPWKADPGDFPALLSSRDDGTLAMVVIAGVAWLAWFFVAVSVLIEVAARLRGLPAPSLPGLGAPQRAVGQLVAVAALLFVAAPTAVAAFPTPPAFAAATTPALPEARIAVVEAAPGLPEPASLPSVAADSMTETSTIDYTVKRGDSLWRIADQLLGDGARFPEIVELNQKELNGRPDFIVPGSVLKVPDVTTDVDADRPAEEYVVRPGDTLSDIAEAKLGDPMRYPALFESSRDTVQPDGATLTDPDLIRPGWEINIPPHANDQAEAPETPPAESEPPRPHKPPAETPTPVPTPAATAEPEPEVTTADVPDDEVDSSAPGWLLPGLTGAGTVLAGLVLLAVRAHRNTQLRYRRPGQTIAHPPLGLRHVEKTALVAGAPLTATIGHLDRALRHLAATCADEGRALPSLATVTLARGSATLHLAHDDDLPAPWKGGGREWSTRLGKSLPDRDVIPPYPQLVTVGQDATGGLHLVNLEHLSVVSLAGDSAATEALARHIAAELALNPWSVLVQVDLIGLGEELATLDPMRLRHHAHGEQTISSITRSLTAALDAGSGDPEPYRAIITTGISTDEATAELASLLSAPSPRLGVALVSLGAPLPEATSIEVDRTGQLQASLLGLDLRAAGLTCEEAAACAAIVDVTRESEPVPIPTFDQAADGWRSLADHAGALREDLTDVREEGPAGEDSLLPASTDEYAEVAATTPEDVETLAPVVPERVRRTVEEADPTLDEDVADWFDSESERPKLTLLGPVNARAHGEVAPVITKRKPYFVELFAFLALHPKGATGSFVADAFAVSPSRARTQLSVLRDWLGTDARTGRPHLPAASESRTYRETGVKTYQLQDVLIDVDLFRRLRARGEARGADGIEDLRTAMSLVEGIPFSLLREKGWSWLLDGERLHETIGCAIVDTAHILVIDALANGDLSKARDVAETACKAAPYDDICRLDLVKVAAAEGHEEAAERMLADDVFNRTDDHLPPIDLPERTGDVVRRQRWGNARRRPTA